MGVTKTHRLRIMELKIKELVTHMTIVDREESLIAILDVATETLGCRPIVNRLVDILCPLTYAGELDGAYNEWRAEWLKKQ